MDQVLLIKIILYNQGSILQENIGGAKLEVIFTEKLGIFANTAFAMSKDGRDSAFLISMQNSQLCRTALWPTKN